MTELKFVAVLGSAHAELETEVLETVAKVHISNVYDADQIPTEIYENALGILQWHTIGLRKEDLEKFKKLKIIARLGAGYDNIDIKAAGEQGIAVCNVPTYGVEEVADNAMCLMLCLYRRVHWLAKALENGKLFVTPEDVQTGAAGSTRLRGQSLGIVGLGRIGTAVALRAKAFGFEISFFDPYLKEGVEKSFGFKRHRTLEALLKESDCVSLHCFLDENSKHMINAESIKQMRPGAFLVNTARGGLVDETALAAALLSKRLGGAGLDVHEHEPFAFGGKDTALTREIPNLICTPHSSWFSEQSCRDLRQSAALEVRRGLTGKIPDDLLYCVNKQYLVL